MIVSLAEVNQPQRAMERCEEYLRDFKNGPNAETVGYLLGASALQANDPRAAETYFGKMLEIAAEKAVSASRCVTLLGNAKFRHGKHDEAVDEYKKYLQEFPKGQNVEDVNYRIALCSLFSGKYEDAIKQLNDYSRNIRRAPSSATRDIGSRSANMRPRFTKQSSPTARIGKHDFPKNQQLGEVLALLG